MPIYRRGLWGQVASWQERAHKGQAIFRLPSGIWIVTAATLASQVLVEDQQSYPVRPAFLRVRGTKALPNELQTATVRRLLRVLRRKLPTLSAGPATEELWMGNPQFRSWGIQFMREYFRPVISDTRPAAFDRVIDTFVTSILVEAVTRGRRFMNVKGLNSTLQSTLADEFSMPGLTREGASEDLVSIVSELEQWLAPIERAELYLRLVTALLAATGIGLEWTVVELARWKDGMLLQDSRTLRHAVFETQRLHPSSWVLGRESRRANVVDGNTVAAGDSVVVASCVIHRDPSLWPQPDAFLTDRWRDPALRPPCAYLPFSSGYRGVCPARHHAVEAIQVATAAILERFVVEPKFSPGSRPFAFNLLAPPRGELNMLPRGAPLQSGPSELRL